MTTSHVPPRLAQLRVKHLTLLEHIAEQGSLRRVAAQLHVTQPAVTAMVQELEAVFGAGLVRRERQGAFLTERGQAARERLGALLNELDAVRLAGTTTPAGRLLRVGTLPMATIGLAAPAISALRSRRQGLTVRLVEQTVESALADVHANRLDCAISRVDADILSSYPRDAFALDPLLEVALKVAGGRAHPLARQSTPVTLAELAGQSWALLRLDSQIRLAFEQAFLQGGLTPPLPVVESLSFVSNLHLVRNTDLLTLAPAPTADAFRELGVVAQIDFDWPVSLSPLMLITRRGAGDSSELEAFRAALHECAHALREPGPGRRI